MSELDDLKKEAVERIYLIPDRDEGRLRYVWCDDPSPEYGMRDDDAVEYVRRDKYDALAAHVEALREKQVAETCACSHDNATDVCLGHSPELRKVRDERDALAAHVERIKAHARYVGHTNPEESITAQILSEGPTTSLDRLKAQCWKEAYLAGMEHGHHWTVEGGYIPDDEDAAEDYVSERQAAGETND